MTRFISRTGAMLLLLLLIDRGLYTVLSFISAQRIESGGLNVLYSGLADYDIVFFGSSRTSLHINPSIIKTQTGLSAYNFGLAGTNFDQHLFSAEEYLLQNTKPKLLVFEADMSSLADGPLRFLTYMFKRYDSRSMHSFRLAHGPDKPAYVYYLQRFKDGVFLSSRFSGQIPDLISGYANKQQSDFEDYQIISGAHLVKGTLIKDTDKPQTLPVRVPSEERRRALTEFLRQCRLANIKVVLLMSPYYRAYQHIPQDAHALTVELFGKMAAETGQHFLDYTYEPSLIENPANFYNENHLNLLGANAFSAMVGDKLAEIAAAP